MVRADDIAGYAQAIIDLLQDEARARAMGEAARRRVVEHFTWERESAKLLQLYADLTRTPGSVARPPASAPEIAAPATPPTPATVREAAREAVLS
jgi:hypothetical protein